MTSDLTPKHFHSNSIGQALVTKRNISHKPKFSMPNFLSVSGFSTPKSSIANSSFYDEIESLLHQIDPTFKLFLADKSPFNQIIQCLKTVIDVILKHKKNFLDDSNDYSIDISETPICEHCGRSSVAMHCIQQRIIQESDRLKKKVKSLEKFKYIQSEKMKEEKEIMKINKEKLEKLMQKVIERKKEIIDEDKENKKNRLAIELIKEGEIAVDSQRILSLRGELALQSFSVFKLENDMDFTSFIQELDSQIANYNKEICIKEEALSAREQQVFMQEVQVKKQLNEIEMMSISLNNSKHELLELKHNIFPTLEFQSEMVKQLIQNLTAKQDELNNYESKPGLDKTQDDILTEIAAIRDEAEQKYKENCEYAEYLENLQRKMDKYYSEKNKEIRENGEQLEKLQENVNNTIDLITKKERELHIMGEILKEKERLYNLKQSSQRDNTLSTSESNESLKPTVIRHSNRNLRKSMYEVNFS